ncbi:hypothetical protein C8R45DRAFT_144932 [Mycena sanguinolenta]|nr:hypothetical protein C8R45DRAFT_144932 [Mycena sanguinolenta]
MVSKYLLRRYSKAWAPNATVIMLWVPLKAWTLGEKFLPSAFETGANPIFSLISVLFFATQHLCLLFLRVRQVWQYVHGTAFSKSERYYGLLYGCCVRITQLYCLATF